MMLGRTDTLHLFQHVLLATDRLVVNLPFASLVCFGQLLVLGLLHCMPYCFHSGQGKYLYSSIISYNYPQMMRTNNQFCSENITHISHTLCTIYVYWTVGLPLHSGSI